MMSKYEILVGLINTQNNLKKCLTKIHRTMVVGTMKQIVCFLCTKKLGLNNIYVS